MKKKQKANQDSADSPTLIGANSYFEGSYKGSESICIEGEFKGNIEGTDNVYVHKGGRVDADIQANYVIIYGEVNGNIHSKEEINIGATGQVNGDVETPSLTVVTGGFLNGQCRMPKEANETSSQGKFGSWKKKKATQSKPAETDLGDLETAESEATSEENTQERSAEL